MTYSNVNQSDLTEKTVLITGGAKRIGANASRLLHAAGFNIIIHCRYSVESANELANELNQLRENSAYVVCANLDDAQAYESLIEQAVNCWGRLDVLINNASSFFPTPVGSITLENWDNLINSNMKAPLFLSQAAAPQLKQNKGCIINMVDIHAQRPMREHTVYCAAKAGLMMITQSLAKELGPDIRVNGVAPGAILWPEDGNDDGEAMNEQTKTLILDRTALKRPGEPDDIAKTLLFLIRDANYITGQIISVDGGRLLNI